MCLHTRRYIVLYNIEKHVTAFEEQALCVLHPNMGQRRMKRRVARASTSKSQAWRKGRTVRYGEMRQDTRNDSQETRRGALRRALRARRRRRLGSAPVLTPPPAELPEARSAA